MDVFPQLRLRSRTPALRWHSAGGVDEPEESRSDMDKLSSYPRRPLLGRMGRDGYLRRDDDGRLRRVAGQATTEREARKVEVAWEQLEWTRAIEARERQCAWVGCHSEKSRVDLCEFHILLVMRELCAVEVEWSHRFAIDELNQRISNMRTASIEQERRIQSLQCDVDMWQREASNWQRRYRETLCEIEAEVVKPERPVDGTVYALRVGGFVKIGWASDLAKRMRQYPPDSTLLATMPGTRADEHKIHKRLAVHRAQGREWFAMTPPVMEWVDSVAREHGRPEQPTWSAKPVKVPRPHSMAKPFAHTRFA